MTTLRPSVLQTLLFGSLFLWMFLSGLTPIQTNDVWWHLATGRYIVQHHAVPKVDVFSFTCRGSPWINTYWLFEVALYATYLLGQLNGVIVAKALLVIACFLILDRSLRESGISWFWRFCALLLTFCGAHPRSYGWLENASLATLFFVTWLLGDLTRWRRSDTVSGLWKWPFLFGLWANVHRGFLLGLALAGVYSILESFGHRQTAFRRWTWLAACGLATLCTPFGPHLYRMIRDDLALSPAHVAGWAHTPWGNLEVFWAAVVLLWGVIAGQIFRREKDLSWGLVGIAAFLTWSSVRYVVNTPYLVVFALPYVCRVLSDWTAAQRLQWDGTGAERLLLATGLVFTFLLIAHVRVEGGVNDHIYPVQACDFIQQQNLRGPFYEEYRFGGYWMWRFDLERPVFIDGRYPAVQGYIALQNDLAQHKQSPSAWQAFLSTYQVTAALMSYPQNSPMPSVFRLYFPASQWSLVYWDDVALIYVRRTAATADTIRRFGFNAINPDLNFGAFADEMGQAHAESRSRVQKELLENQRRHPESLRTRRFLQLLSG